MYGKWWIDSSRRILERGFQNGQSSDENDFLNILAKDSGEDSIHEPFFGDVSGEYS